MTTAPQTIGENRTLAEAQAVMHRNHCRHLPVLTGGRLVSILTERDIALVEGLKDGDPRKVTVEEAMSQSAYSVDPSAALDDVVKEMASKKYGSAVVVQGGRVVGIFTTVDACSALAELLHGRLAN